METQVSHVVLGHRGGPVAADHILQLLVSCAREDLLQHALIKPGRRHAARWHSPSHRGSFQLSAAAARTMRSTAALEMLYTEGTTPPSDPTVLPVHRMHFETKLRSS